MRRPYLQGVSGLVMAHHTVRFTIPQNLPVYHVGVNSISNNSAVGYKSQGRKDERSFRD